MAFFDNFSKKVQDVAFVATEKAQQVAAVAGEKANAVADKAKTEYEMASERRSMDKNYRAIGEWYVSTLEGDALPNVRRSSGCAAFFQLRANLVCIICFVLTI